MAGMSKHDTMMGNILRRSEAMGEFSKTIATAIREAIAAGIGADEMKNVLNDYVAVIEAEEE